MPCGQNARQRRIYARQRLCRASADGKGRTAKPGPAKSSLPCASPKLHGKAVAVWHVVFREPRFSTVRALFAVRCASLPCPDSLPCASPLDARQSPTLCREPHIRPHGKVLARHTSGHHHVVPLPCVCARHRKQAVLKKNTVSMAPPESKTSTSLSTTPPPARRRWSWLPPSATLRRRPISCSALRRRR